MKNNAKESVLQARPKAKNPWMDEQQLGQLNRKLQLLQLT